MRTYVRIGSVRSPAYLLRTDVRNGKNLQARAAHTRRPASHPLVPIARGRLRRRLGGRPGRGTDAEPPAPSAVARAREAVASSNRSPTRRSRRRAAALPIPRRVRRRPAGHAEGSNEAVRAAAQATLASLRRLAQVPRPPRTRRLAWAHTQSAPPATTKGRPGGGPCPNKPAASYSPRPLRAKYHRR